MEISVCNAGKIINKALILNNVNLTLNSGRIYGLYGPNGSGKTMFMRLIAGLIRPTTGSVRINGLILGKDIDFPPSIGVLIENPALLPNYTGYDNLKLLAEIKGLISTTEVRKSIERVGLNPDDKRMYRKYSLGMKQRIGIAAAIMEHPDIILLDEPTNALDDSGVSQIKQILFDERDRGALIVIACHDSYLLEELADEIFFVNAGTIAKRCVHEEE